MSDATCCNNSACGQCPDDLYVCHCLKITEEMVVTAIACGARTLKDLRVDTGAGDGCTACHHRLNAYLLRRAKTEAQESERHSLALI